MFIFTSSKFRSFAEMFFQSKQVEGDDYDPVVDRNKILAKIRTKLCLKIATAIIFILTFSYLFGCFWYMYVKIQHNYWDSEGFFSYYGQVDTSSLEDVLSNTYFAITTLATIGLGDFHPESETEQALFSVFMLLGIMLFTYLLNTLVEGI